VDYNLDYSSIIIVKAINN